MMGDDDTYEQNTLSETWVPKGMGGKGEELIERARDERERKQDKTYRAGK